MEEEANADVLANQPKCLPSWQNGFFLLCHASVAQAQPPVRSSTERVKKMRDEQQKSGGARGHIESWQTPYSANVVFPIWQ